MRSSLVQPSRRVQCQGTRHRQRHTTASKCARHSKRAPFTSPATNQQQQQQRPRSTPSPLQQTAVLAATLAASLALSAPQPASAAQFVTIGDYVSTQPNLVSVDSNKDGEVTESELAEAYKRAGAVDMPRQILLNDMHMYDLNADGRLTAAELATGSGLDAMLGPDYLDGDLWNVLDKDGSDSLSYQEWMRGLGDVGGAAGEAIKDLLFRKVDAISIKDGELDEEEAYWALQRLRNVVLGYDPADYEFEEEDGGEYALDADIVGLRPY